LSILSSYKLIIVDKPVLVPVVGDQDGIDHLLQLLVQEYLRRLTRVNLTPMLVTGVVSMPVYETLDQLAPIQLVVPISVVHLEVVELQLLVRHLGGVHGHIQVLLHVLCFMSDILVKHPLLTMATLLLLIMTMAALLMLTMTLLLLSLFLVHLPCLH